MLKLLSASMCSRLCLSDSLLHIVFCSSHGKFNKSFTTDIFCTITKSVYGSAVCVIRWNSWQAFSNYFMRTNNAINRREWMPQLPRNVRICHTEREKHCSIHVFLDKNNRTNWSFSNQSFAFKLNLSSSKKKETEVQEHVTVAVSY